MICKNCGAEISNNAVFCNNCGTKIEKEIQEAVETAAVAGAAAEEKIEETVAGAAKKDDSMRFSDEVCDFVGVFGQKSARVAS